MKYFDHDTEACKDDLIVALRLEHTGAAVDAYWAVLEYIYFYEQPLILDENRAETKSVCHWLCLGFDMLQTYVSTMVKLGLLTAVENSETDALCVTSERANNNIAKYKQRAETARENGKNGGRKPKRNRNKTESVSKNNPDETKSGGKGKGKGIGLDKLNQYQYVGVAEADKSAPPTCPNCDSPMNPTNTFKSGTNSRMWQCPLCLRTLFDEPVSEVA